MSIKIAGADIKNVMVAGAGAKSVRLGTGAANVEVWSAVPPWVGASGTIAAQTLPRGTNTAVTYTIPNGVSTTVSAVFTINYVSGGGISHQLRIEQNGITQASEYKAINGADSHTLQATFAVSAGDTITFITNAGSYTSSNRQINASQWSVTPV